MKGIFLIACTIIATFASGQMVNIVIDSTNQPEEPTIAIDPKNPMHVVGASNNGKVYVSLDGGYHWASSYVTSSAYGSDGDPVMIADTTGAFYYFHLADDVTTYRGVPESLDRIVCQKAADITTGVWTDGSYAGYVDTPATDDKPGIGVDRQTNTLYACWTKFDKYMDTASTDSSSIYFSMSTGGLSWSPAVRLNQVAGDCSDSDPTVEGAIPCVGPNGEIYVSWASYDAITFDRSLDHGATWLSHDIHVTDVPGGWNYSIPGLFRCNGLPFTACDLSNGPFSGNIYVNWTDQRNGVNNTDVWVCTSSDTGNTWSAPVRVNDDTGSSHQFMSSMTVDPATGFIYVLFYDRRNYAYTPDSNETDVYLAVSKDGAATFRNYLISESPFQPVSHGFMGDYTFISAFNSKVMPVWTRFNVTDTSSDEKVLTAIIDSSITGLPVPVVPILENTLAIYPNPTRDKAFIAAELAACGPELLSITDISGRKLATVTEGNAPAGRQFFTISARDYGLSAGIYFVTLKTPTGSATQKLVVVQ